MSSFHRPTRSARPARAVLVAACLGLAVTATGCGDSAETVAADTAPTESPTSPLTEPASSTSPSASPSTSPSTSASPTPSTAVSSSAAQSPSAPAAPTDLDPQGEVIPYAGGESPGVLIHRPADVTKLHGSPASFKRFIGRAAARVVDRATCSDASVGIMVQFVSTAGFAVGSVNECGGYAALWAVDHGRWREIEGTQDAWDCAVLKRYAVPSDLVGETCYDYDAQKERPYHQL